MKHSKFYAMALLMSAALFTTASCDSSSDDSETPQPTVCPTEESLVHIVSASTNNAFPLFSEVDAITDANENFTISPLSLSEALAIASNGANGDTRKQITEIIGVNGMSKEIVNETFNSLNDYLANADSKTTFSIANSVWIDEGFEVKPEFLNDKKLIGETFYQNLSSTKTMNDFNNWCDTKTNGCIKKVLSEPLSGDCMMVIANALHFKGMWKYRFDKKNTSEQDFYNSDGTKSKVKMMSQKCKFLAYSGENMDMVELPYGNENFCMDVILPHEGKNLDECMKDFTLNTFLYEYIKDSKQTDVVVQMPRMKLECTKSLITPLMAMGMTDAFLDGKADFTGISDSRIFISDVKQSTYVNVDEEGTEAAAVTTVELTQKVNDNVPEFRMDRPFTYIIRERTTGTILFMGKVRKL